MLALACGTQAQSRAQAEATAVRVAGQGFRVDRMESRGLAFSNRKYTWVSVPAMVEHWQYTQTGGGVAASITAIPETDGKLYIACGKLPDDSGWQPISELQLVYSDKGFSRIHLYSYACKANVPVAIPQHGWTGTLLLAPRIDDAASSPAVKQNAAVVPETPSLVVTPPGTSAASPPALLSPPASPEVSQATEVAEVKLVGDGFRVGRLETGGIAFANRKYVWVSVPAIAEHLQYTRTWGGVTANMMAIPKTDGVLYVASDTTTPSAEWQAIGNSQLILSDRKSAHYNLYAIACRANVPIVIPQYGWSGTLLLAPAIDYTPPKVPVTRVVVVRNKVVVVHNRRPRRVRLIAPILVLRGPAVTRTVIRPERRRIRNRVVHSEKTVVVAVKPRRAPRVRRRIIAKRISRPVRSVKPRKKQ